jgi:Membrane proteins related to metalloendopeptidases
MKPYIPLFARIGDLPAAGEPGAFGTVRKHDVHTGVDIYARENATVYAIENGVIVAIEKFTGEHADSPWWNNTWSILVEGVSGVVCYGELRPMDWLEVGDRVSNGEMIGMVVPVLKKDKGVTPTSMLHFELYKPGTTSSVWWHHGEPQPETLLDPTELLKTIYA